MAETTTSPWLENHTEDWATDFYNNASDEVKKLLDTNPDYTPQSSYTGASQPSTSTGFGRSGSASRIGIGSSDRDGIGLVSPNLDTQEPIGLLGVTPEVKEIPEEQVTEQVTADLAKTPEQQLIELQLQQLQEEQEWNELLRPQLLRNMGLTEVTDPVTGARSLRAMTEEEKIAGMTPEEKSAYETERLIAEQNAQSARGEREIPGYVEDELSRQREIQQNVSSQRLGAKGANLSTAGINAKVNQFGNEMAVKNAYQHGQEGTGIGLLSGYNQYLGNQAANNQNVYGNFSNAGMGLIPMAQTAAQPYTFGRQLQDEQGLLSQSRQNAFAGGILSGVGTAASIYLTKGMGGSK